ncbi:hypothetical protein RHGRI_018312 [Rhododendron griersonianum]|uniref:Uncharacterized protein n=1 Tax=Rhododendron griersonianum TaxID=479676 RepID=A0AAV6K0Z4_9ERIC|nr:hypothetical protein RHGRI_018312 [Rhododendron griersonianum]
MKIFDSVMKLQTCFFRQFGNSVVRADYLTLRKAFILNHNLTPKYDFHSYMIRSMEEEFQKIVGVSKQLNARFEFFAVAHYGDLSWLSCSLMSKVWILQ